MHNASIHCVCAFIHAATSAIGTYSTVPSGSGAGGAFSAQPFSGVGEMSFTESSELSESSRAVVVVDIFLSFFLLPQTSGIICDCSGIMSDCSGTMRQISGIWIILRFARLHISRYRRWMDADVMIPRESSSLSKRPTAPQYLTISETFDSFSPRYSATLKAVLSSHTAKQPCTRYTSQSR